MNESRQQDEIESLKSIYGDIFTDLTPTEVIWNKKPSPHFQIDLQSHENPDKPIVSIVLDIKFTPTYPTLPPVVKILHPKNLLKARIAKLHDKISEIEHDYKGEELCFTIIMDIKEMLDEFQQTTEEVLSLEEERARRLEHERKLLESKERENLLREQLFKRKMNHEVNQEMVQLRHEFPDSVDSHDSLSASLDHTDMALVPRSSVGEIFVFENTLFGYSPISNSRFPFKAVQGFIRLTSEDLLLNIGSQFIVRPYIAPSYAKRMESKDADISYVLHQIDLEDEYWLTSTAKERIRDLEVTLEKVMSINSEGVLYVYGFQIDQNSTDSNKWTIRILTELPPRSQTLEDVLNTTGSVSWALSRSWLIQILPTLELLHNKSLPHRLLSPASVAICDSKATESSSSTRITKLCHPTYGYAIQELCSIKNGKVSLEFTERFVPRNWKEPDSSADLFKTDVWDLGVLFLRLMLGIDLTESVFPTPSSFFNDFRAEDYHDYQEYAERVHDILSKMLQQKASKRFSLLELNAVKFLRAGIDIKTPINTLAVDLSIHPGNHLESPSIHLRSEPTRETVHMKGRHAVDVTRRTPVANTVLKRRYSNNNSTWSLNDSALPLNRESRYQREFEEVGRLGKGGFGEVVKARNRMEGTFYAIKKIKHRADKLEGLLSEVLSLARLNHQYIVRYYSCWVEEIQDSDDPFDDSESSSDQDDSNIDPTLNIRSSSFLNSTGNSFQVDYFTTSLDPLLDYNDDDFDDRIVFANSGDDQERDDSDDNAIASSEDSTSTDSNSSASSELVKNKKEERSYPKSILYIQMEFCENNTLLNLIERGLPANSNEYWRLFRQILEAVSYIHNAGFIHRDLKPTNIFIDKSNNVKVGDFGLAKSSHLSSALLNNNQVNSGNKDFSTVVGTFLYTAKEVATGDYNEKVDMYSLGVIFFEMCYELGTGMERALILNDLRLEEIRFPREFTTARYSTERTIVRQLLDHDPSKRPGAGELLQSGLLPVEHQDEIIKEALKSLADPASPWQQQVRESLFNQPYLLARDMMFDQFSKNSHSNTLDHSENDYLIFNLTLDEIFRIFHNHGGVRDYDGSYVLPKLPTHNHDMVYEILDRSGAVLTLAFDLVLPMARFLSKNTVGVKKLCRHEFVYRPNIRKVGVPDKYSAVSFDIISQERGTLIVDAAESIKVVDEILDSFPCFKTKYAQTVIIMNHSNILNSCIDFAFGGASGLSLSRRQELMGILSQVLVEKGREEIKATLRNDFKIQHTIVKELLDSFDFVVEPSVAQTKLRKAFVDSPLLTKVEKAIKEINETISVLNQFGLHTKVMIGPLSNYNAKYYEGGIMFQALHRIDKTRKFSRVVTGGRYDHLINTFASESLTSTRTNHVVGFQLTTTLLLLLMKNSIKRTKMLSAASRSNLKWRQARCDILVTSSQERILRESGYNLLKQMWQRGLSSDFFYSMSQDDLIERLKNDGCNWLVTLKQIQLNQKFRKSQFKPIRVRNIATNRETDLDYDNVVEFLQNELEERRRETIDTQYKDNSKSDSDEEQSQKTQEDLSFNLEVNQKVAIVPNAAPRGRKNNKREKRELETDAQKASASMLKELGEALIVTVELLDATLDMILSTSLEVSLDEWLKKLFFTNKLMPRSYATNIYDTLNKEKARGSKWAVLYNPKTKKSTIVDLQR